MHDQVEMPIADELPSSDTQPLPPQAPVRDERYEYRLALVERCREELQRVTIEGDVAVVIDPEGDAFAGGLCRMLGASGSTLTFASLPAESLLMGLGRTNPELAAALTAQPPVGFSWVVVVGRGGAGMALFPTQGSSLN
ncbi:MAG TPA: hypothetical protein VGP93_17865 [Polyangiaceae bacterium]|nr:hypothetical protein [Polyangiaceae bacterium]